MRNHSVVLLAVCVAACDSPTQAGSITAPAMMSAGVRTYLVQEPGGTSERTTFTIHVEAKDLPLAAYQGRLEFDASAMEIIDASTPSDGTRLVNATSAGPGVVRFAGFSGTAFGQTAAVTLVVRLRKSIDETKMMTVLGVAGEELGTTVSMNRVSQLRGIWAAPPTRR